MVTDQQVLLLRRRIMEGKSQQASAAAAGMSASSAHRWRSGLPSLPSEKKKRSWRTHQDAFRGSVGRGYSATATEGREGEAAGDSAT